MKHLLGLLVILSLCLVPMSAAAPASGDAGPLIGITMSPHSVAPGQTSNLQGFGFLLANDAAVYVVGASFVAFPPPQFGDYQWLIAEPYYVGTFTTSATKTCLVHFTAPVGVFTEDTVLLFQVWEDTGTGGAHNWHGSNDTSWVIDLP